MGVLILKETRKQEVGVYVSPWTRVARACVREKGKVTVYVCVCVYKRGKGQGSVCDCVCVCEGV